MNIIKILAILLFIPWQVNSAGIGTEIELGRIDIKLDVTALPIIEIRRPLLGRQFDDITLNNSQNNPNIYQSDVPVTVKLSNQTAFRVSVKNELILTRQANNVGDPERVFSPAQVYWGKERTSLQQLSADPKTFTVDKGTSSLVSTDYILRISALAPSEPNSTGMYHGQLTLIIETNS
ncbi:fimbrial protein [Yersinia frederiksenii]|nr:fimbrial protein [Yersinia frederiksenii]